MSNGQNGAELRLVTPGMAIGPIAGKRVGSGAIAQNDTIIATRLGWTKEFNNTVSVDPFKSLEDQVKEAIDRLKPMIPLSFESVRLAFKVPGSAMGKVSRILRPYMQKEQWLENGSWASVVECPAGMKPDLIGQVMKQSSDTEVKEL